MAIIQVSMIRVSSVMRSITWGERLGYLVSRQHSISSARNLALSLHRTCSRQERSFSTDVITKVRAQNRLPSRSRYAVELGLAIAGATLAGLIFTKSVSATVVSESDGSRSAKFNFIADVVENTAPAVVYIEIQQKHLFMNRMVAVSNGSGFIVRSDGLILTNAHVVGNNSMVECRLHDGRRMRGRVQAVDPISDLATVKVDATDLPTMKLGSSGKLRPGEWVIAMGSPLQLSNTVTAGIVSSAGRQSKELGLHNKDINYIQTDATINFGNSGGPLVNLDGEAIGINTMMVTSGISFAIPSDYAKTFLEKAAAIEQRSSDKRGWFGTGTPISPTTIQRGYLGITMLSLTPDIIRALKSRNPDLPDITHGVYIHRVAPGSPASTSGIRSGDIIVAINGSDVHDASDVYKALEKTETLRVTLRRDGQVVNVNVTPEVAIK